MRATSVARFISRAEWVALPKLCWMTQMGLAVEASGWTIAGLKEYGATDPMSAVAVLTDSF